MGGDLDAWVGWGAPRGGCYWKPAAKVDRKHLLKGKHKSSVTDKMFEELAMPGDMPGSLGNSTT